MAVIILVLAALCVYGWAVRDAAKGDRSLGRFSKLLDRFAGFPDKVAEVLHSGKLHGIAASYLERPTDFQEVNKLQHELYGLGSFWDPAHDAWSIRFFDLRADSVLRTWSIPRHRARGEWQLDKVARLFENAPPLHSLMLEDRSVITKLDQTPNLMRVDTASNEMWVNHELIFHHSIQRDADGGIWTCGSNVPFYAGSPSVGRAVVTMDGMRVPFQDDFAVKVDAGTGRILYKKSICDILMENGMQGRLYSGLLHDPIHLNDVNPVLVDGPYWKKGDLFLSIRNLSLVLLFRPSEDRVVRVIEGPLVQQHDVNILPDHRISVFNNRAIRARQYPERPDAYVPASVALAVDTLGYSQVLVYDLADSSFTALYDDHFHDLGIRTRTQGLHEVLPDGELFVEVQNKGICYVIGPAGVVMSKVFLTDKEGYVHGPNWTRIYDTAP